MKLNRSSTILRKSNPNLHHENHIQSGSNSTFKFPIQSKSFYDTHQPTPTKTNSKLHHPLKDSTSNSINKIRNRFSSSGHHAFKSHQNIPTHRLNSSITDAHLSSIPHVPNPVQTNNLPPTLSTHSSSNFNQHYLKFNPPKKFFGLVKRLFTAAHSHELTVHAGESVLINAYCESGWFVCKPISRLGKPGLVPMTHVQICDMISGKKFSNGDTLNFLRSSGLPQVQQWSHATASYRYHSIPLDSLDNTALLSESEHSTTGTTLNSSELCTQFDLNPKNVKQDTTSSELVLEWQQQQLAEDSHFHASIHPQKFSYPTVDQLHASHGPFICANAESFYEEEGRILFLIIVQFATHTTSEKSIKTFQIHRTYSDLLAFDASFRSYLRTASTAISEQLNLPKLMDQVPTNPKGQQLWLDQLENFRSYLSQISRCSREIRSLRKVYNFLAPSVTRSDFELRLKLDDNQKEAIQHFHPEPILLQHEEGSQFVQQIYPSPLSSASDQRNSSSLGSIPSPGPSSTGPISDDSSYSLSSDYSSQGNRTVPSRRHVNHQIKSYYQSDGEFTKIKIYQLQSDVAIALRVLSNIGLKELSAKIADRLDDSSLSSNLTDNTNLKRKIVLKHLVTDPSDDKDTDFIDYDNSDDEQDGETCHLRGKLKKFLNDEHLFNWMQTEDKLIIYV